MSDLLKDVIADAKAVKAVAYANAKAALEEAFAPSIQRMVSARLAEEEAEDEEMPEPPAEEAPEGDDEDYGGEEEMDFDMEEPAEEGGEDSDLELEALIRELEGEDEMMEMEDEDEMMESLLRELGEEGYLDDGDDATPSSMGTSLRNEAEGEDEDEMIEALIRELSDEDEMMGEEEEEEMAPVAESRKLRRKVKSLQKKLNETLRANAVLKSTLSELNLLNAKLMYATKVNRMSNLSESLQMKVLQAFDRASTTREVQLVYTTLAETLKRQSVKRTTLREGASKPTRAMVPSRNEFSFAPRWAQLAGISKNSK